MIRRKLFIQTILLLLCFSAKAQFTESRESVKRFAIKPETRIDITNKYGRIELNTWEKDSVVIKFRIEINEKKPDKLAKTYRDWETDRKSTRLNSSHSGESRMPSSA